MILSVRIYIRIYIYVPYNVHTYIRKQYIYNRHIYSGSVYILSAWQVLSREPCTGTCRFKSLSSTWRLCTYQYLWAYSGLHNLCIRKSWRTRVRLSFRFANCIIRTYIRIRTNVWCKKMKVMHVQTRLSVQVCTMCAYKVVFTWLQWVSNFPTAL